MYTRGTGTVVNTSVPSGTLGNKNSNKAVALNEKVAILLASDEGAIMKDILIVVDMQNDFVDGALGTAEAVSIVPNVKKKIEEFDGLVLFTRDTHESNYLETQEGKNLPVPHCIRGTHGWEIREELEALRKTDPIDKITFGSSELGGILCDLNEKEEIGSITFIGICTDICVISNAMIAKAFLPEVPVIVDARCCAGVSVESHENALKAMEVCQVNVLR